MEREYRDGEQDGRERKYDGDGVITCENMWQKDRQIEGNDH